MAPQGDAWIYAIYLDGQPVSMQIVLRAGTAAFTWKTAYDETLHDFSPGMLLLEEYTAALLADPSIAYVDSCSLDDSGFMAAWGEREAMAEMWIDSRRGGSAAFAHLSRLQEIYCGCARKRRRPISPTCGAGPDGRRLETMRCVRQM